MNSQKHGKGLPDMKRYVVDNPEGQLHILVEWDDILMMLKIMLKINLICHTP